MTTVLVVDDSPTVREVLHEYLTKKGYEVLEAQNGLEAQRLIQASVPHVVITDIIMPEMNGYELCRWIRSQAGMDTLPVIMCSSKNEEFDVYWGNKQGASAYLTKPFRPEELLGTIRSLLSAQSV